MKKMHILTDAEYRALTSQDYARPDKNPLLERRDKLAEKMKHLLESHTPDPYTKLKEFDKTQDEYFGALDRYKNSDFPDYHEDSDHVLESIHAAVPARLQDRATDLYTSLTGIPYVSVKDSGHFTVRGQPMGNIADYIHEAFSPSKKHLSPHWQIFVDLLNDNNIPMYMIQNSIMKTYMSSGSPSLREASLEDTATGGQPSTSNRKRKSPKTGPKTSRSKQASSKRF
jgi:Txe/YoeB family toxin of Txe-Axe toxin-antitoxin module